MSIRHALARWLAPDVFENAERYGYLRGKLSEAQDWLGYDFPEVDAAIVWAKVSEVNHFRPLDAASMAAVPGKPWIWSISAFREHLKSSRANPSERTAPEVLNAQRSEDDAALDDPTSSSPQEGSRDG